MENGKIMMDIFQIFQVVVFSAMPLVEVRGGLPLALVLEFPKRWAFFYGVLGNTLGLFAAFFILDHLMPYLKKIGILNRIYLSSTRRALRGRKRYLRLRYWALYLLVAIPLPGTGAWTAALVSYLFRFDRQQALLVIFAGIVTVTGLMLTLGVITIHGFRHFF